MKMAGTSVPGTARSPDPARPPPAGQRDHPHRAESCGGWGGGAMNTRELLVTGGTGGLGRRVVERLEAAGVGARVMSRSGRPGTVRGDLLAGEGLDAAVWGVETVIHCASSPYRKTREVDIEGTRRLLEAATGAGVSHFVYISIVGDRKSGPAG